jgi:uncharacterized protein
MFDILAGFKKVFVSQKEEKKKVYINYNTIHKNTVNLAKKIKDTNIDIDYIIAIGTGGFIPGRIMKSCLNKPLRTVTVELYNENDNKTHQIKQIQWLSEEFIKDIDGKNILIIDEMDDTRTTLAYCANEINKYNPNNILIGVLHNKLKNKLGVFDSKFIYIPNENINDIWVVYPWENTK